MNVCSFEGMVFICVNLNKERKGLVESKYSNRGPDLEFGYICFIICLFFLFVFTELAIHDLARFDDQNKRNVLMSWIRITVR